MEAFINKYSDVPKGFIKDFFNISKESYNDNEIIIDFDKVVKWLKVKKFHLKRLLVSKFEENYDYTIEKINIKRNKGGTQKELIYITPDTFKHICMLSQTAKAKQVRKYYLSIEKLVRKYHIHIENKLYKELGLIKKNQKPKYKIKGGVVYILRALNSDLSVYKIGRTKNLDKRLNNYNSGLANDIDLLFILEVNDIIGVENCIKNLVRNHKYRKYKEVYEIDLDILRSAFLSCDELVNGFKKHYNKKNKKKTKRTFKKMRDNEEGLLIYIDKNK